MAPGDPMLELRHATCVTNSTHCLISYTQCYFFTRHGLRSFISRSVGGSLDRHPYWVFVVAARLLFNASKSEYSEVLNHKASD